MKAKWETCRNKNNTTINNNSDNPFASCHTNEGKNSQHLFMICAQFLRIIILDM